MSELQSVILPYAIVPPSTIDGGGCPAAADRAARRRALANRPPLAEPRTIGMSNLRHNAAE
jgi:hypothetical protein